MQGRIMTKRVAELIPDCLLGQKEGLIDRHECAFLPNFNKMV
jgi:hypothetical protein